MRRLAALALAALFLLLAGPTPSQAVEIHNLDKRAYTVVVKSSAMTKRIRLRAGAGSLVVCAETCSFRIAGVGRTRAGGNDILKISKRKLHKTAAPAGG